MKKNNKNVHHKKEKKKSIKLGGIFLHYDKKNLNERIYSKEICEDMIKQFQKIKNKQGHVYGELEPDYNNCSEIDLEKISHEIAEIYLDEESKSIVGTIKILETPQGDLLKNILEKDLNFVNGFSVASRGIGNVNKKGEI